MSDTDLFEQALGLKTPWRVERSIFSPSEKRLAIHIDFEPGGTFACPEGGRSGCKAWDTSERTWRHLNVFEHEAPLHARAPRVSYSECGVKQAGVPWARAGSGFMRLFEAFVRAGMSDAGGRSRTHAGRARHPAVARAAPLHRGGA